GERLRGTLGRYVSGDIAERILSEDDDLSLRGEVRHVAVLFLDVRGFTTISEKLTPTEVVALLNEYFDVVVDRVAAHGGTVNKFIGDAAMCIWGAPKHAARSERSAVLCALEKQARAKQLSPERTDRRSSPDRSARRLRRRQGGARRAHHRGAGRSPGSRAAGKGTARARGFAGEGQGAARPADRGPRQGPQGRGRRGTETAPGRRAEAI